MKSIDNQQKPKNSIPTSPIMKINSREQNQSDNNRFSIQDSAIFLKQVNYKRFNSLNKEQTSQERIIQRDVSTKNVLNQGQQVENQPQIPISNNFMNRQKIKILQQNDGAYLTDRYIQQKDQSKDDKRVKELKQHQQEETKQFQQNIQQLLFDRNQCDCKQKIQELQNQNNEQQQQVIKLQNEIKQSKNQQLQLEQQKLQFQIQIDKMKNDYDKKYQELMNKNYLITLNINQQQNKQTLQIEQQDKQIIILQKEIDTYLVQLIDQQELKQLNEALLTNVSHKDQKISDLQQQIEQLKKDELKLQYKIYETEQQNREQSHKINQQTLQINRLQINQQNSDQKQQELLQQIQNLNLQLQQQKQQLQIIPPQVIQESYRYNKIKFQLINCDIQKENLQILLEIDGLKNVQFKFNDKGSVEYQMQNESLLIEGREYSYQIIRNQNESYTLKGQGFQQPFQSKEAAAQLLIPSLISNFILMDFYDQLEQMKHKQPTLQIPNFEFVVPFILKEEYSEQYWIAERQHHGLRKQYNSKEGRIFQMEDDISNNFLTAFSFYSNYTTMTCYIILDFMSVGKFLIEPSICDKLSKIDLAFLANFRNKKLGYKYLDLIGVQYLK